MRLIKDSRGHPSWHLTLAIPITILITAWFIIGGVSIEIAGLKLVIATKSGTDYLAAITPWLAALGWREYTEKVLKNGTSNS